LKLEGGVADIVLALKNTAVHDMLLNADVKDKKHLEKRQERSKKKVEEARRDLRKTFESLDNEEDGSSVQRITRSSVNSDTNRRSRQLSSRSSRASGDSVEDILADLDSIQYAMQQDDGVKDIVEIANDEFDEDDISNDEGLGKSHVKVAYPNVIVSYSSQDLRIISKSGQLVSRLEPSSIIEGVKAYTVSLFQVQESIDIHADV
tara:strand:+ start:524 stop:1138 length:615 start_codon:yes stop_codon:yes gene_type:complete